MFVSPNLLLSASWDESIQCWDLPTGQSFQRLEVPRPYTEMDITGAIGLTDAQHQTLTVLGACDRSNKPTNSNNLVIAFITPQ